MNSHKEFWEQRFLTPCRIAVLHCRFRGREAKGSGSLACLCVAEDSVAVNVIVLAVSGALAWVG